MRRAILWTGAGGLLGCALALWLSSRMRTDPPPAPPPPALERFWIEARMRMVEEPTGFGFVVSGHANLPPDTVLRARIFAVEEGGHEDEEPLVWGDEESGQPAWGSFRAGNAPFELEVCRFRRRPYSLRYRTRVVYDPESQRPEVRSLVGEKEVSVAADLRVGSDAALASEFRARLEETREDLEALEGTWRELRREIARQGEDPDPGSWHAWTEAWRPRLAALSARNGERFGLWCVWPERQAKMRLGGVGEYLGRLIDDQAALLAGEPDRAGRVKERLPALAEYLEETRDVLGFEGGLDPETFAPLLARYDRALGGLPATRGDALAALLRCAPPLLHRMRAYAALNDVGFGLARLLEAPGPETRAAHGRALASFKSLAGID